VRGVVERHGHRVPRTHRLDLTERCRQRTQIAIATVEQKRVEDILGARVRPSRDDDGTSIETKPDHAPSSAVERASCVSGQVI
jgi:hypothetical protein